MAELDRLDIVISASAKQAENAIGKLTASLRGLEKALNIGSLNTFVARLERLGNVASTFNGDGVKGMTKALKDLSKAGRSLANFGLDKVSKQAGQVSSQAKYMSQTIAQQWGITDRKAVNSLAASIQSMYDNIGNNKAIYTALHSVDELIKKFSKTKGAVNETADAFRKFVSGSTIKLPEGMKAEWGDDYLAKLRKLGMRNFSTTEGATPEGIVQQFNSMMGSQHPDATLGAINIEGMNTIDVLSRIVEELEKTSQSFLTYDQAISQGAVKTEALDQTLEQLAQSVGTSVSSAAKEFMNSGQSYSEMKTQLASAAEDFQKIGSAMEGAVNPFERIVQAIEMLPTDIPDFSNLTTLAKAMGQMGGASGSRAGQSITQIATGLRSLDGIQVAAFGDEMTQLTQQLRALGSRNIVNAANSLGNVATGLREIGSVGAVHVEGLADLAQALSMFGRSTAQNAITTIPQLATAFRSLIDTLSTAPNVSQNVIDLANAMANLSGNMRTVPAATNKASSGLNLFGKHAQKAQKSAFSLAATIGKLYASYWMFMRVGRWFGSSLTLASDLVETQNIVDNVFADMSDKMDDFAKKSVDTLGMSELTAKKIGARFQAMGQNMNIPKSAIESTNEFLQAATKMGDGSGRAYADVAHSMADVSLNLTKLTGDMASFYNMDYEDVAKDLESAFTGMTKPLRKYGLDITQATLKDWAWRQGMQVNFKTMSQYEKMLLRYQYIMANTTEAQGDFQRTIDTWANTIKIAKERIIQLKKVLGTIGINTFKPLVKGFNNAMNSIIHLAESTLNALGKIFGWHVEITDVGTLADDSADLADNLDDAAGSAKKMKDYMLGIDELNVFNPDDGKGGGGGDVSSSADASQDALVKWEKTAEGYDSIYDTLYKLGKRIGEVEKEWLQGIDWDSIYDKAERFGKGLASFLNGYLSDAELFYEKGRLIANALNTIGHALAAFADEFDGYQLGVDIGSWINGITYNIDWDTLNRAASGIATDLAEAINGTVKTADWEMVGKTIAEAIGVAVNFASTFLGTVDFSALGKAFGDGISGFIRNLNVKDIAGAIKKAIQGAFDFASSLLANTDFAEIGRKIGQFLKELKLTDYIDDIARLIGNVLVAALKLAGSMILEAPFESALIATIAGWRFLSTGNTIGNNLGGAISTAFRTVISPKLASVLTTDLGALASNTSLLGKAGLVGLGVGGGVLAGVIGYKLGNGISQVIADLTHDEVLKDASLHTGERFGEIFSDGFTSGIKEIGKGLKEMFRGSAEIDMSDNITATVGDDFWKMLGVDMMKEQQEIHRTWSDVLEDIRRGVLKLGDEDFAALKESMINTGIDAAQATTLVNGLQYATNDYYTYFPEWLEKQTQLKKEVDIGAISMQYAYQQYLSATEAKKLDEAATGDLTVSETDLAAASEAAGNTFDVQAAQLAILKEQYDNGDISAEEFKEQTKLVAAEMDSLTESTKKTTTSFNGMPSGIASAVTAMNESSEATLSAEEESAKFQELWNNYTISNIDISQLHEINTVLTDINDTSTNLVSAFEENFGKIFSGLTSKLEESKTAITTFDEEINTLLTTMFDETIPTDFDNTTQNLDTFLDTTSKSLGAFDEELGKQIDSLFDETLPEKFETTEKSLTGSLSNIEKAIGNTISEVQKKFEAFLKWFDNNVFEKTKADYWNTALSGVSGAFETTFQGVANTIATIMNSLIEQINSSMNVKWDNLVVNGQTVLAAGQAKLFEITPIPMYERGGFPEDGLFYANHNELVGGFANGKTAVANNEQIVGGIREGVQEAMTDVVFNMLNPYLSDIAQSSRETANKDFSVNIGDRDIAMAANRGQSLVGMSIIS